MSTTEDTAMAESSDPASRFRLALHKKKAKKPKESEKVIETAVELTFHYPMRILITVDNPSTKATTKTTYNPIPKVKTLLMTMAELDPGLTVTALDGKSTLIIGKDKFPITETAFKQFFSCDWDNQGKSQNHSIRLGCQINGNRTLNNLKHAIKPNPLLTWLYREKVFLEADALGIGKTKTIGYLTHIHPRLINRNNTKVKLAETLEMTHIEYEEACKLDTNIMKETDVMIDNGDEPTVQCPPFEIFHTTIGSGPSNACSETDVIGIKCKVGKAALVREFFLQTAEQIEKQGQGKFVPAGLANVIGKATMSKLIQDNNQYLKNITSIPIYGLPTEALKIVMEVNDEDADNKKVQITVLDYILAAEWCHGLEPTDSNGKYLIITTVRQVSEAREWIDNNLEAMFTEFLPNYGTFPLVEGYEYPKRGDKPRYSSQLGTYADKLRALYPTTQTNVKGNENKWNRSPLHNTRKTQPSTLIFDTDEYPTLTKPNPKRTNTGEAKPQTEPFTHVPHASSMAQDIQNQILQDMKEDFTKMVNAGINVLREELTTNLDNLKTELHKDLDSKITTVLKTIQILNQRFTEVMDRLPPQTTPTPAHKKPKGLGVID